MLDNPLSLGLRAQGLGFRVEEAYIGHDIGEYYGVIKGVVLGA